MTRLAHVTHRGPAQYAEIQNNAQRQFLGHHFFRRMPRMGDDEFKRYLLERMQTSSRFIEWYNRVLACMKAEDAKEAVRAILRDEVPQGKPTHFEDLTADLKRIGIPAEELCLHKPSLHTIRAMDQLIETACNPVLSDLERLVFLHVAGEMLVACEYGQIVNQIAARFGLHGRQLRFYAPHAEHDSKGGSHDACFVAAIERRMHDETDATAARRIANRATEARFYFFEQFNS